MARFFKKYKKIIICVLVFTVLLTLNLLPKKSALETIESYIVRNSDFEDYKISSITIIKLPEKVEEVKEEYIIDNVEGVRQCIDNLNAIRVKKSVYNRDIYHNLSKENCIINFYDDGRIIIGVHIMSKDITILGKNYRISNYSKTMIQRFYEIALRYGMKK